LSQGNEHLLSSSRIYFTLNQELFLPSSFSVHPHQERPWANTGGSPGPSRCWGYVHLLLIQGYVPGWIRFVRKDLVCVHSDGFVSCLLFGCIFTTFLAVTCRGFLCRHWHLYIPSPKGMPLPALNPVPLELPVSTIHHVNCCGNRDAAARRHHHCPLSRNTIPFHHNRGCHTQT
jgi:hypothetical protein